VVRTRRTAGPKGPLLPCSTQAVQDVADSAARLTPRKQRVDLLMVNRSFDHMLGYLRLKGVLEDVDGLRLVVQSACGEELSDAEKRHGPV